MPTYSTLFTSVSALLLCLGFAAFWAVWTRLSRQKLAIRQAKYVLPEQDDGSMVAARWLLLRHFDAVYRTPVFPSPAERMALTRSQERNRRSFFFFRLVTQVLLIWGICGTLWSVYEIIPRDGKIFATTELQQSLLPGAIAVSGYVILLGLGCIIKTTYERCLIDLEILTQRRMLPRFRKKEARLLQARRTFQGALHQFSRAAEIQLPEWTEAHQSFSLFVSSRRQLVMLMSRVRRALCVQVGLHLQLRRTLHQWRMLQAQLLEALQRAAAVSESLCDVVGFLHERMAAALRDVPPAWTTAERVSAQVPQARETVRLMHLLLPLAEELRQMQQTWAASISRIENPLAACDARRQYLQSAESRFNDGLEQLAAESRQMVRLSADLLPRLKSLQQELGTMNRALKQGVEKELTECPARLLISVNAVLREGARVRDLMQEVSARKKEQMQARMLLRTEAAPPAEAQPEEVQLPPDEAPADTVMPPLPEPESPEVPAAAESSSADPSSEPSLIPAEPPVSAQLPEPSAPQAPSEPVVTSSKKSLISRFLTRLLGR